MHAMGLHCCQQSPTYKVYLCFRNTMQLFSLIEITNRFVMAVRMLGIVYLIPIENSFENIEENIE